MEVGTRVGGVAAMTAGLLVWAVPASAGGWWTYIDLDKDPIAVGETVTATAQVSSPVDTEVDGHHAYLVRGTDREALDEAMTVPAPGGWWTPPAIAIHLAEVEVSSDGPSVATATFTVPDVEPGLYDLMFCSSECAEPLAEVIPLLDVAVHGDALLAHTVRTLGDDPLTESHLTMIEERIGVVDEQVRDLRTEVNALRDAAAPPAPAPPPTPTVSPEATPTAASLESSGPVTEQHWIAVAAAFLAGAALAAVVVSLRQRRRDRHVREGPRVLEAQPAPAREAAEPGVTLASDPAAPPSARGLRV